MTGSRTKGKRSTLRRRDGALCVSFANTWSQHRHAPSDYTELLSWLVRHGAFEAAAEERLVALAAESPEEEAAVFAFAESSRELLWEVFNELAEHRKLSPELLQKVNSELVDALPRQRIAAAGTRYRWELAFGSSEDLGQALWPVILSLIRLLTSTAFTKVRRCAGEGCDLLFVQRSGSPRKWCSMKSCGQSVKSRRYYYGKHRPAKQKAQAQARQEAQLAAWRRAGRSPTSNDDHSEGSKQSS